MAQLQSLFAFSPTIGRVEKSAKNPHPLSLPDSSHPPPISTISSLTALCLPCGQPSAVCLTLFGSVYSVYSVVNSQPERDCAISSTQSDSSPLIFSPFFASLCGQTSGSVWLPTTTANNRKQPQTTASHRKQLPTIANNRQLPAPKRKPRLPHDKRGPQK